MPIHLEPHGICGSNFAYVCILTLSSHWHNKWSQGFMGHYFGRSRYFVETSHNSWILKQFYIDQPCLATGMLYSLYSLYYSQVTYTYNNMRSKYIQCHFKWFRWQRNDSKRIDFPIVNRGQQVLRSLYMFTIEVFSLLLCIQSETPKRQKEKHVEKTSDYTSVAYIC